MDAKAAIGEKQHGECLRILAPDEVEDLAHSCHRRFARSAAAGPTADAAADRLAQRQDEHAKIMPGAPTVMNVICQPSSGPSSGSRSSGIALTTPLIVPPAM